MLFTQLEFLVFFAIVLIAAWSSSRCSIRNTILLVASYYFYAYWDYRFCALLLLSTLVDFVVAKRIAASADLQGRRRWLGVSLATNLGVLGFFKYFNFFIESADPVLRSLGIGTNSLEIVLPVGVSFFTFQTLSYTIDVYRGRLSPTGNLVNFALFVAFFPQLVAGPIVRARELLPQLREVPRWSKRQCYGGAQQLLRGAVKKVLLADRLAEMVDVVFAGPELYSGPTLWLAALAYAGQIYYDFSGYTDMAIGAAKMLGYRFPINFKHPYLATSVDEFWHRWHMTLSRWLRDYLYIPLGGSRVSEAATRRNLMITMTLGGLWHGAAWTYVVWGLLHGIALVVHRQSRLGTPSSNYGKIVGWTITMVVVLVGWVLFRSPDITSASDYLWRMFTWAGGIGWYPPLVVGVIGVMVIEHLAWRTRLRRAMRLPVDAWYSPIATVIMIWSLLLYAPRGFQPFVYFQF